MFILRYSFLLGQKNKPGNMNRILTFLVLFVLFSFSGKAQVSIHKGILDLRYEKNFKNVRELNGEWEFYWNKHYMPADFTANKSLRPDLYGEVPSYWIEYKDRIPEITTQGFVTYRLRIIIPQSLNDQLLLKIPIFDSSYRLYVNGSFINSN